jgi:hypothetical protein
MRPKKDRAAYNVWHAKHQAAKKIRMRLRIFSVWCFLKTIYFENAMLAEDITTITEPTL